MTLYLIRHGDTVGTLNKIFYGSTDLPLAKEGYEQIEKLKTRGVYPAPEGASLYTSGMTRTEQTFEAIYGSRKHRIVHDLREIDLGKFEMTHMEDIMADEQGRKWVNDETAHMDFPGGDTYDGFRSRVHRGLGVLIGDADANRRDVIAILHGAVITTAMDMMFPGREDNIWAWTPDPARGYSVYIRGGKAAGFRPL